MALTLSTSDPDQSSLTRPDQPHDPNGIAHAIDPTDTGDGVATKAGRATTKLAYASWAETWKANSGGDPGYSETFPVGGSGITYSGE